MVGISQLLDYAMMGKIVMEMSTAVTARVPVCLQYNLSPGSSSLILGMLFPVLTASFSPCSFLQQHLLKDEGTSRLIIYSSRETGEYAALGSTSFPCTVGQGASFTHLDGLGSCGYHGPRL